jgi:predicted dehydrogenase
MLYNVKAGIIGLGDLGVAYARLIIDHVKNLNLIAACGRSQKELLLAKNELSLEYVYSDEKSLIENHDIEVIFNFSNEQNRAHLSIMALEAGKHLFVANPIALNVEDAIAVRKTAQSHPSQQAMAISNVRFSPLLHKLKETLELGTIGKINHIELNNAFVKAMGKSYHMASGSAFLDSALEELDLCLFLMEDTIEKVDVDTLDKMLICHAKTTGQSSFSLMLSDNLGAADSYLKIYGSKGHIIVANNNAESFQVYDMTNGNTTVHKEEDARFNYFEYLQLHHFTRVLLGKEKSQVKLDHAVELIKLAVGFEKSKVLEQPINLLSDH